MAPLLYCPCANSPQTACREPAWRPGTTSGRRCPVLGRLFLPALLNQPRGPEQSPQPVRGQASLPPEQQ